MLPLHIFEHFTVSRYCHRTWNMPNLQSKCYVFDPRPEFPLFVAAKQYWIPQSQSTDPDAVTLVLAHGTSFLNEHWEPVIEDLYELVMNASTFMKSPKIRDIWAIEAPNHGVGAQLNEAVLKTGYYPTCECRCTTRVAKQTKSCSPLG
jgi:hypothetical protein